MVWMMVSVRRKRTFAGISYVSCKSVRSSIGYVGLLRHTEALSGMKRSPRTSTSRDAIVIAALGLHAL